MFSGTTLGILFLVFIWAPVFGFVSTVWFDRIWETSRHPERAIATILWPIALPVFVGVWIAWGWQAYKRHLETKLAEADQMDEGE